MLIHQGCDSFQREFAEGAHAVILVANGRSKKLGEANDQRSDVALITVQPRVKTEKTTTGKLP